MHIFSEAETWVAIAFVLFIILIIRLGWSKITAALDERSANIKNELNEARNLREDAQSLLADYQRKKRDSEKEISGIIDKAKTDAENEIKYSIQKHKELLQRRKKTAEDKIAQAQERALKDITESIVELSISSAQNIIKEKLDDSHNNKLLNDASKKINKEFLNL